MLAAHISQYLLLILSWWLLGRGVLGGRLETGWLAPVLARLKELELLQEILAGTQASFVFGPGDVLLADDLTGQGHISRQVDGPRLQVFARLSEEVDLSRWR